MSTLKSFMSRQYLCLDTPSTTVYLLNWSTSNKHYGPNWAPYCHLNEKLKEIKWIIFQSHQSPRLTFGGKGTIKTVQMFTINVSRTPPHGKLRLCNLSPWTKLKLTNLCCKCNQYQKHWWNYKKKKREKNKQKTGHAKWQWRTGSSAVCDVQSCVRKMFCSDRRGGGGGWFVTEQVRQSSDQLQETYIVLFSVKLQLLLQTAELLLLLRQPDKWQTPVIKDVLQIETNTWRKGSYSRSQQLRVRKSWVALQWAEEETCWIHSKESQNKRCRNTKQKQFLHLGSSHLVYHLLSRHTRLLRLCLQLRLQLLDFLLLHSKPESSEFSISFLE